MKTLAIVSAMIAVLASGPVSAQTAPPVQVQISSEHSTHVVFVDERSGRVIATFEASIGMPMRASTPPSSVNQPHRAFDNIAPLTIQQENEAAERALEQTLPPLHTP